MADEEAERQDEGTSEPTPAPRRRRSWSRRILMASTVLAVLVLLLVLIGVVIYRTGTFDQYVKNQFVERMAEMNIVFDAEVFQLRFAPLELHLRNATFKDRITGQPLFSVREAHLQMTVQDLYALQMSRDLSIDKTDITGAEVWVNFDENGRSNFSNVKLIEPEKGAAVNFKYESVLFSLQDSTVHFGDLSRKISGEGRNMAFLLSPAGVTTPDGRARYNFDLTATESSFTYDKSSVDKIDVRAVGIADDTGADISRFDVKAPIGQTSMTGRITDWSSPHYDLDVTTTLDVTRTTSIFPVGSPVTGVGNFKGHVSGQGENYRIEGEADSESLRAEGLMLKGINIQGTLNGTSNSYDAQGRAVAQMLTFDDLKIDFLKMVGNVRGTGTDFRWVGDLEAAAASTDKLTLGRLFLSDAVAEYKDRELRASAKSGRTQRFAAGDLELTDLAGRDLRFLTDKRGGVVLTSPAATARSLKTSDYALQGINASGARVTNSGNRTDVKLDHVRSETASVKNARVRNLTADNFNLTDTPTTDHLTATNLRADQVTQAGTTVNGVEAPSVDINDNGRETLVYADRLRVAKLDTDSAVLGSLNIGGVRLTIRQGRVEGRTDDIDAGRIAIKKTKDVPDGGQLEAVKIAKPIFVLEPSGRYRASADMSIGGGSVGSIPLGNATAKVDINNERVDLNQITANVMDGVLNGQATIALNDRGTSRLTSSFTDLDLSKLLSLQGGRVLPLEGKTTGRVDLTFNGTSIRNASGTVNADIRANAGQTGGDIVPVTGQVRLTATNGLFNVDAADLNTAKSKLTATGRFDLKDNNTDLAVALRSADASEIDRLVRVLNVSPQLTEQLDSLQVQFAGNLAFDGRLTGNIYDPAVDGRASLDGLSMRGTGLGSVSTDVAVSPAGVALRNGKLQQSDGGSATFAVNIPYGGTNNVEVKADLNNVNAGSLLAALPITLPDRIRDFSGRTTGTVDISGLPDAARGEVNLAAASGVIAGQSFDNLKVKAVFNGTSVDLQQGEMHVGAGVLAAKGTYDRRSENFNFELTGKSIPAPLAIAFAPKNESIPSITGDVDFTATASGVASKTNSYNINFSGTGRGVKVGENALGDVAFKGNTINQVLTADLTATLEGRPQVISATVNLGDENLPLTASTEFNQSPLAPFFAFVPALKDFPITGTGTGRIDFGGNISSLDSKGNRIYSAAGLTGRARFTQLSLLIRDTPLNAAEPVEVRFNPDQVVFEHARFTGGGSNMSIAGTVALSDAGTNDLRIDGRINLALIPALARESFKDVLLAGYADTSVQVTGPFSSPRLNGRADLANASVAAFIGSDRFQANRMTGRVIFTTDQVQIEEAHGYLGGGKFTASGGGYLDGLSLAAFRFSINGDNVTVPLPTDFVTTGDAQLELTGRRTNPDRADSLVLSVSGRILARRSLYTKDIDLASIVGGRREAILSGGGGAGVRVRFDGITIEGRDALVVRNNVADLTASVNLTLTGDSENPRVAGRVTANSGTIFFRKDRYEVQRGVVEFPPETEIDPVVNLQAETEIAGYQIFVNLAGPLRDTEQLNATVRSSPALPQADVVSLITTGSLTNSAGGIPTLAQSGINTAAEVLTDAIINQPIRKATDKLFGLNVFEIDPIISGQTNNATARLTVGRQINNNLRVTYSTNLSQDQQQVLAFEYRVSNKLSFVAQYEQRSLTNVTRNRDNFSFEVRFRRRF